MLAYRRLTLANVIKVNFRSQMCNSVPDYPNTYEIGCQCHQLIIRFSSHSSKILYCERLQLTNQKYSRVHCSQFFQSSCWHLLSMFFCIFATTVEQCRMWLLIEHVYNHFSPMSVPNILLSFPLFFSQDAFVELYGQQRDSMFHPLSYLTKVLGLAALGLAGVTIAFFAQKWQPCGSLHQSISLSLPVSPLQLIKASLSATLPR